MKILLVNKFYYNRGGDCVCMINLEHLLRSKGHDVRVYAMQYSQNIPCESAKSFASEVSFSGGGVKGKINALKRVFGWGDIVPSFKRVLDEFKPDVVHLNNIHSYLSPVVAQLAKDFGCKVVWTLHDYKLVCPSYSCLSKGQNCELCFTGDKRNVLKERCMKGSLVASTIAYLEAVKWNRDALERCTDSFICPSRFMADKMLRGGFSQSKLKVLCNFVDPVKYDHLSRLSVDSRQDYYCYIGRMSPEKGVASLLEATSKLDIPLKLAGDGPQLEEFRQRYSQCRQIEFLGRVDADTVCDIISHARFMVMPSVCYENNPLGVIESLCAGTPVLGANIGGIPELIDIDRTGQIYTSGDVSSLRQGIVDMNTASWDYAQIKTDSLSRFSADTHYRKLIELYK